MISQKLKYVIFFIFKRLAEHIMVGTEDKDRIKISTLYSHYLAHCIANEIKKPTSKQIMGRIVHKLFGRQKAFLREVDSAYYYENIVYIPDSLRDNPTMKKLKLPPFMSFEIEHELVSFYFPTTFVVNTSIQEFLIIHNGITKQFWMHFGGTKLDNKTLGLGSYSEMDQMFINSIATICKSFVICEGKAIDLPEGRSASRNLVQTFIGRLGPNNQTQNVISTYYSKNCFKILPLSCELNNRTCQQCIQDIHQRIRQLRDADYLSPAEAEVLLKPVKHNSPGKAVVSSQQQKVVASTDGALQVMKVSTSPENSKEDKDEGDDNSNYRDSVGEQHIDAAKGTRIHKGVAATRVGVSKFLFYVAKRNISLKFTLCYINKLTISMFVGEFNYSSIIIRTLWQSLRTYCHLNTSLQLF